MLVSYALQGLFAADEIFYKLVAFVRVVSRSESLFESDIPSRIATTNLLNLKIAVELVALGYLHHVRCEVGMEPHRLLLVLNLRMIVFSIPHH